MITFLEYRQQQILEEQMLKENFITNAFKFWVIDNIKMYYSDIKSLIDIHSIDDLYTSIFDGLSVYIDEDGITDTLIAVKELTKNTFTLPFTWKGNRQRIQEIKELITHITDLSKIPNKLLIYVVLKAINHFFH